MHKLPRSINNNTIEATSRIDQAQVICPKAALRIKGNPIPPTLLPTNAIPVAIPLLRSNQWDTTASAVVVRNAELPPLNTP